jgi:hypothetical protein
MPFYYIDPKPIKIPNLRNPLEIIPVLPLKVFRYPQKTIRSIGPVKIFKSYNNSRNSGIKTEMLNPNFSDYICVFVKI